MTNTSPPKSLSWTRAAWLHLRPRSFPIVWAHAMSGAACALILWPGPTPGAGLLLALLGAALWAVALNGGTLAINSAFDRDEGDIGYLDNPPPVPHGLAAASLALMLAGLVAAYFIGWVYFMAYAACLVLSLLYSVPPIRLKAVAGPDVLINMIGYGGLTFAVGAAAAFAGTHGWGRGRNADWFAVISHPFHSSATTTLDNHNLAIASTVCYLAAAFAFLFGVFYPTTQIYQMDEDRARGDRTLAIMLGKRGSLIAALLLLVPVAACMYLALKLIAPTAAPFVAIAFVAPWAFLLLHWLSRLHTYPEKKGMYRALIIWACNDIGIIAALWWLTRVQ